MGFRIIMEMSALYQGYEFSVKILVSGRTPTPLVRKLTRFWSNLSDSENHLPLLITSYPTWGTIANGLYSSFDLSCIGVIQSAFDNFHYSPRYGELEIKGTN